MATALTANDADPTTSDGALDRIRAHLRGTDVESLVALIIDLAERDDLLFRRLDMKAATAADDDKTVLSRLRKAVTDATHTGGFIHYSSLWVPPLILRRHARAYRRARRH